MTDAPTPPPPPPPPPPPQYYGPQPTWAPSYAAQRPPLDGFAVTTLITGIFGMLLFSVGFGIASLRRIRRGVRRGRGLTIAGLAISLAWVVVIAAVIAYHVGREPSRNTAGAITAQGHIAPRDLHIGDCVEVPRQLTGPIKTLSVMPCSQPHNGQVFTTLQAPDGAYPGSSTLENQGLENCQEAATAFLGTDETLLHVVAFVPLEAGWSLGDRGEHCLLVDRSKDFTGDIRSDH